MTTSIPAQDRPHFRLWFALPHTIDIGMIFVAILGFDSSTEPLLAVAAVAGICVGFIFLWGGFCDACGLKLSWLPYLYIGICAVKCVGWYIVIGANLTGFGINILASLLALVLNSVATVIAIGQRTVRHFREQQREIDEMEGDSGQFADDSGDD